MPKMATESSKLNKYGKKGLIINFFFIILSWPILMASAGTINWINGWVYFGLIVLYQIAYTLILLKINPELLNERGKFVKEGTKKFDKVYVVLYMPLAYLILIISGFDAVRYGWTNMSLWISILGVFIFIFASSISLWAISVNAYFECTVLIQKGQKICKSGPYKWIRHPGYAAGIVSFLATPFILGSWWAILPSALISIMFFIRTLLEDRTLQHELDGYKKYTKTTKYRLVPWVW